MKVTTHKWHEECRGKTNLVIGEMSRHEDYERNSRKENHSGAGEDLETKESYKCQEAKKVGREVQVFLNCI